MTRRVIMPEPEDDPKIQYQLRLRSEEREGRAHQVAAALDEVLLLAIVVLTQAAQKNRGMQARRAKRLAARFRNFRDSALEGRSPCAKYKQEVDGDIADMDHRTHLVR